MAVATRVISDQSMGKPARWQAVAVIGITKVGLVEKEIYPT